MAAPSYTTDLNLIQAFEGSSPTGVEMTGYTQGGTITEGDTDYFIQGNACYTAPQSGKTGLQSIGFDNTSSVTVSADECLFMWQVMLAGNAMDTFANGGLRLLAGSGQGDFYAWKTGGNDFNRNPYGGWQCSVVDPTFTEDYTQGSPTGTWQWFGSGINMLSSIGKGNLHGLDILRYGRGELIIEYGDVGNGYGTFAGIATQNDSTSNRWGLFQAEGVGYLWKGLMSFGNSTNACDFRDSNVSITIEDTPRTYAAFNKVEITNASSRVDWTGVAITAINASGLSIGQFEMIDDATINFDTCTFTDMSTFIFDSNATITSTTFRRCGQVTQAAGTFTSCIFDQSTASMALVVDSLTDVTDCTFISDGTGHAVNLGTVTSDVAMPWGNIDSGYASTDGSTGNETLRVDVDPGITLTINVASGASTPTIYNTGTGSVDVVATYTLIIKGLKQNTEIRIYKNSDSTYLDGIESAVTSDGEGAYKFDYTYSTVQTVYIKVMHIDYVYQKIVYVLDNTDGSLLIQQQVDRNYNNPQVWDDAQTWDDAETWED